MKRIILLCVLLSLTTINAQKTRVFTHIVGYVYDEDDNPVKGAKIFFDKVNTGKKTNRKGKFVVKVKKEPSVITIYSVLGVYDVAYKKKDVLKFKYSKNSFILFSDKTVHRKSDEVGNKKGKMYKDIYEYLEGRIAGVEVTNDKKIRIRSASNYYKDEEPTFVLNGDRIPTGMLNTITPSSIISVKVLKGNEAAFYGVFGENGVIVITTKK